MFESYLLHFVTRIYKATTIYKNCRKLFDRKYFMENVENTISEPVSTVTELTVSLLNKWSSRLNFDVKFVVVSIYHLYFQKLKRKGEAKFLS